MSTGQLGFDFGVAEPRPMPRVSPARLATFDDCPRRYRLTYVDSPSAKRKGAWAHSTLGTVVHNALRALFTLPVAKRTPAKAVALVAEHWIDAGFDSAEQAQKYRARAQAWVSDYVEHGAADITPIGIERWVSAAINAETGEAAKPSIVVEGRIDRLDQREGDVVIVDYKTGRFQPTAADAKASQALALYAVVATQIFRKPVRAVELHHVPTGTVAAARHTQESLREHLAAAERTASQLTEATDSVATATNPDAVFPARPAARCSWCDFRPICAEGREASPPARSWDWLTP